VDQGHLSGGLAGRAELSFRFLEKILSKLGSTLTIRPNEEVLADIELKRASDALAEITEAAYQNRASA
jgi:hypothetical protein